MELGRDMESSVVEDIVKKQKPNQCASLVYTVSLRYMHCEQYIRHRCCIDN